MAKEIMHSFMYPYSNAEGINNTIKILKRISCGIKSYERICRKVYGINWCYNH
ncbi:hypothetical protein AHA02nite_09320 [Alkalibacillus haloalkaliphilus]|uniref:Transposase IS204/IS1001/IS1096/IS1165 DDE domain-containing protein n=1 Tax=Alkalibacillus haloalkaliphilus TaxID=94136 RepID=A0A511W266_9BACI|nr:hypothetical protein AHA02nite_09320 [Alkalibacillus haloalkaliphilus]